MTTQILGTPWQLSVHKMAYLSMCSMSHPQTDSVRSHCTSGHSSSSLAPHICSYPSVVGHQLLSANLNTSIGHPMYMYTLIPKQLGYSTIWSDIHETLEDLTTQAEPLSSKPRCSLPCLSTQQLLTIHDLQEGSTS